jgi:hypothetical protein
VRAFSIGAIRHQELPVLVRCDRAPERVTVRHLLDDPLQPDDLLPSDWPGSELRQAHLAYNDWLIETPDSPSQEPET